MLSNSLYRFYTEGIVPAYLVASAGICVALFVACKKKVAHMGVYTFLGVALWFAMLKAGVRTSRIQLCTS